MVIPFYKGKIFQLNFLGEAAELLSIYTHSITRKAFYLNIPFLKILGPRYLLRCLTLGVKLAQLRLQAKYIVWEDIMVRYRLFVMSTI